MLVEVSHKYLLRPHTNTTVARTGELQYDSKMFDSVAQWQSTGGSSKRPSVRFPAAPLFLSSPCHFKGLPTVAAPIVSLIDKITIGLRITEESCLSDSSIAVITLSNFSHHGLVCLQLCLRMCVFLTCVTLL